MSLQPQIFVTRQVGHQSFEGGRRAGPPLDLTCLWVRLPGTGVSVMVDRQPTPPSGAPLPIDPKRAG